MVNDGANQALAGVTKVNDSDIICGRGGLALKHSGNMAYRKIVGLNKELYATCLKIEKLRISKSIVAAIREINGRFLEREDGKTSSSLDEKDQNGNPVTWRDIGDKRATEKTSQALREGQPKLLKKLAQRQDNGDRDIAAVGVGGFGNPMANYMQMGGATQSQIMPQYNQAPPVQQNNFVQGQSYGFQHPVQASLQAQQRSGVLQAQQSPSFTLQTLQTLQTHNAVTQNSFVGNNNIGPGNLSNGNGRGHESWHDSWHDSWGDQNPTPLHGPADRSAKKRNSTISNDSWGEENPMPLPYQEMAENADNNEHVFSMDDQIQLMSALGFGRGDSSQDGSQNSAWDAVPKTGNKRPSVKFQLKPQTSAMSVASRLSELSFFSDALSLDSAMDAAEREAEFEMVGEEMTFGTSESASGDSRPKLRRSILRKSNKWASQAALAPTTAAHHAGPGLMFTSTLDTTRGGINSGTDISGIMSERRKSGASFEIGVNRRRSSRMSLCSALTDFSGAFKRDVGSILSIHSTDFRELMADFDDESDDESVKGNAS